MGEGITVEDKGSCPSIAPCLGLEFPLWHSRSEAEVSEETLPCSDRLGLQQWLMHNSSTQHWGKVLESITTSADNIFIFCLRLSGSPSVAGSHIISSAKNLAGHLYCGLNDMSIWLLNSASLSQVFTSLWTPVLWDYFVYWLKWRRLTHGDCHGNWSRPLLIPVKKKWVESRISLEPFQFL